MVLRRWREPLVIRQTWIRGRRRRPTFYNKIGEVAGGGKPSGGNRKNTGADGRLISTQYFYFSDKNDFKKLSAAPTYKEGHTARSTGEIFKNPYKLL